MFIKELEDALLDGRIDLAVHSMKDVPTEMPEGLTIAAIGKREDVRDALLSPVERLSRRCRTVREWARAVCAANRNCFTRGAICACWNFAETSTRESKN